MTTTAKTQGTMAPLPAALRGVVNLLDQYVKVRDDDIVFLLYTAAARDPAAWIAAELGLRGITSQALGMHPVRDDTLEERLCALLPEPATPKGRIVLLTVERNSLSHAPQLRRALAPYAPQDWAVFRLINASEDYFRHSMNVTPQLLSAVNGGMLNRMMPASRLHITSSSGTDLEVELDATRYRWLSNRGLPREGAFVVLPPGEVSTYPKNINGVLVADGAFNVSTYTRADVRLEARPATIEIENGRVVNAACSDPVVTRLMTRCLGMDNGDRVGELGFGTNLGTSDFIPMNSHINGRHPGVHVGLGRHGQPLDVVGYRSGIQLELITSDATVIVDGGTQINSWEIERFANERHPVPHALEINDEDIDGDCCGLNTSEVTRAQNEAFQVRQCQ